MITLHLDKEERNKLFIDLSMLIMCRNSLSHEDKQVIIRAINMITSDTDLEKKKE